MIVSEIKLFELLKAKIDEREAEAFVEILETKVDSKFEDARAVLATKEDLAREIGNARSEMIKWMFIFWASQLIAIFAFLKFFVK